MTGIEIIKAWLTTMGYGGLCSPGNECGCEVSDLAPCGEAANDCEAGYKVLCTGGCSHEGDHDVSKGDWHIQRDPPEAP